MKLTRKYIIPGIAVVWLLAFAGAASAHSLWINMTDHSPEFEPGYGAGNKAYLGWGHHYPVDDFVRAGDVVEFSLVGPDGEKQTIAPEDNGFHAAEIRYSQPGFYLISVVKKPGFYTVYRDAGRIRHVGEAKTGKQNVMLSLYYEQYAKSLVDVGGAEGDGYSKPLGHRLEIIPLENPATLGVGGVLPVKVLFDGQPARSCVINATYGGFSSGDDYAYTGRTDNQGIAKIRLTHWGTWLIKANVRQPATPELRDKCNELSSSATLTLQIP